MASRFVRGGDRLEAALAAIGHRLGRGGTLTVGFYDSATYPRGGINVPTVAAIQEFGAPAAGIPPRPFFRNMVAKHQSEWPGQVAEQLKLTDNDTELTLRRVGEVIAGELRQSIVDTNEPPLAPATVARKGFAKPLVDTGQLLNSIDYEVDGARQEGPRGGNPYRMRT